METCPVCSSPIVAMPDSVLGVPRYRCGCSEPEPIGSGAVATAAREGRGMHAEHPADDGRRARRLAPMPKPETPSKAHLVAVPRATRQGERCRQQRIVPLGMGAIQFAWIDDPARQSFTDAQLRGEEASTIYSHLIGLATRSAAKGRMLAGSVGRRRTSGTWTDPAPTIPAAHRAEDEETAADAVSACWHRVAIGKAETIDVRLVRTIARRFGARRAQHRLREHGGLVEHTDHRLPSDPIYSAGCPRDADGVATGHPVDLATATIAELRARVLPRLQAAFDRAVAVATARDGRSTGTALRSVRRILARSAPKTAAPV